MTIKGPMKEAWRPAYPPSLALLRGLALLCILSLLGGCEMGPSMFLGARDREISDSTQAVQSARNDVERSKAYSKRGAAYSEKARYSRAFKMIPADEYERLFDSRMSVTRILMPRMHGRPQHWADGDPRRRSLVIAAS